MSRMKVCGIHTRVTNLIDKIGGIDYNKRICYLMKTYNLSYEDANLLYNVNNEQRVINGENLFSVLEDIDNENRINDRKLRSLFGMFQRQNEERRIREECRALA